MENQINIQFTSEEVEKVKKAIESIAGVLKDKTRNLTPQQRQQYGRVKYEKQIWIDKVKMKMDAHPEYVPSYIDKQEFNADYTAHQQISQMLTLLQQQVDLLSDTHLLLGYDLDEAALAYYRSIKTSTINNAPGVKTIYEDLKQQFPGGAKRKPAPSKTN